MNIIELEDHNVHCTLKDVQASLTALSINSSEILRDGCSLNTEFISAILAALRLASALVGQCWKKRNINTVTDFAFIIHFLLIYTCK